MARKTSIVAGSIKADELLGFQLRDAVAAGNAAIESLGGGSSTPVPYFGAGGVTYWSINSIADDDTDGNTCTMQWLVPVGTDKLTIFYKYIKANGDYGRLRKYVENDFTDAEIAAGFVEFTMPGIKANKSFDILKAVAKGDGARAANPISDPDPSTLATGAASVGTAPASTGGFPPGSFTPALSSDVLARVVSGDYAPAVVRVTAVGTALKEPDGIYYPVTVQFTAGSYVQDIKLRYQRCGKRRTSGGSGATGQNTIDLTIYGKPKFTPWHDVSDAERTAGSCEINVGPFTPQQARKVWHITRVRARSVVDEKNGDKVVKEKYPSADADMAGAPNDLSPSNAVTASSYPSAFTAGTGQQIPGIDATATNGTPANPGASDDAQGAMLAVLAPEQPVTSTPSEPAAGDVLRNEPDLATEKDSDAIIELRAYVDDSNNSAKAQDVNASEMVFILARDGEEGDQTKWKRFVVALEEDDTYAVLQFHRRIGTRWNWIKNVLRNSTSRVASSVTNYEFQAGATAYRGTSAHEALTVAVGSASSTDDDAGMFRFQVTLTNTGVANTNSLPAIPKKLYIFKNRKSTAPSSVGTFDLDSATGTASPETGDTNWVLDQVIDLRDQPVLATAAAHTITVTVKTRRKKTVKYYAACSAVGSVTLKSSSVGSYDTNTDLPVTNYAHGTKNIIRGGSFVFSKEDASGGVATEPAKQWEDWTGGTFSGTDINTGTTTNVYWEKADHRLRLVDNMNAIIACKIKKILVPGDVYTLSMLIRAQGALALAETLSLQLYYNNGGGGTGTVLSSAVTLSVSAPGSGSDYKLIAFQFTMPSFTIREELWVVFARTTAIELGDIYVDNWMLVRGNQALTWDSSGQEDDWETVAAASTTYTDTGSGDVDANAGGGNDGSITTAGGGKSGALDV